ncbi:NH(3)-dependent NAD synthase [Cenarchaeum symbiosum A]|uniref:NH(3)-dependent NAD(+) synthetase n=1 Tax=Cenarchaeum symbiosum (strain A) TaxID=414004 RepID=A0RXA1_CENSY|nr:NH(3)-dependent NAD synthase [Cenarchaeum symbiosum A]
MAAPPWVSPLNQDVLDELTGDCSGHAEQMGRLLLEQVGQSGANGIVLGLSGGVDSAVAAAAAARVLRDRTLALVMPDSDVSPESETVDALGLVDRLRIGYKLLDISPIVRAYSLYLEPDERARGNLRARVRMCILYYYANLEGRLVVGAGDKSERLLGYFTKFGDGASDVELLAGLFKSQVRKVAGHLGVPGNIISKKSSPHLWSGHLAEKELGASYEEIDSILYCTLDRGMDTLEAAAHCDIDKDRALRIMEMHRKSAHKRSPPAGAPVQ